MKRTAFLLLLFGCPADGDSGACTNDQQCKGERLCIDGACESPSTGSTTAVTAEASSGSPSTGGAVNSSGTSEGEATADASTAAASGSTGIPEQPYGVCRFGCTTTAQCCSEFSCDFGTTYTCQDGLCRGECVPANCNDVGDVVFECATPTIDIPGASVCGASCANNCIDVVDNPAFYCNTEAGYEPDLCILDCRLAKDECTASSGSACLPNGNCGCFTDGDCGPGFECFKQWA